MGVVSKLDFWFPLVISMRKKEFKVKDGIGIEKELIVVKDEKGNEESVKKQLRNVKPICCH